MSGSSSGAVTVGVDIGTTSVKALAVNGDGHVVASARVPHQVLTPSADMLEHDARRAWRAGPRRAYRSVQEQIDGPIAGVTVASMVPSLTAVNARGVPLVPGLLYGDRRGRPNEEWSPAKGSDFPGSMPDAEGFLRWARKLAPDAAGYWPCQGVATFALSGVPAVDSAMVASLGALHTWGKWNLDLVEEIGAKESQLPTVVPMCEAGGTLPGTDTIFTGGTIDALCDQIVAGATEPGDVLAIFGATLVIWIVTDQPVEAPGLICVPHTVPDRFLTGGPSNAGALFVDWARRLLHGVTRPGPLPPLTPDRRGDPDLVPIWLPYLRGERTPFNNPLLRASVHGLDITQGPGAIERGAYEASGFVIRRMLERAGVTGRRVVASGGGTRVGPWMAGVADATGLAVHTVGVAEGAAFGAAFFARMAAGLEEGLSDAQRWVSTGRQVEPDPRWSAAASERYRRFADLGPGT